MSPPDTQEDQAALRLAMMRQTRDKFAQMIREFREHCTEKDCPGLNASARDPIDCCERVGQLERNRARIDAQLRAETGEKEA